MTVNRRALAVAALAIGALAAPSAAQAATTYSVAAGQGACGGADTACGTLADAAGAAVAGDTVNVASGTYAGATFTAGNVTITGSTQGSGVLVNGTLTFSGGGATPSSLAHVGVAQTDPATPAISVTGASGLVLSDSIAAGAGSGVVFNEGTQNKVVRSTAFAGQGDAIGLIGAAASAGDKALTVESTAVTGGAAGIAVRTASVAGGAATLNARHVTASGSAVSVVLDSSRAGGVAVTAGSITSTINDSIVLNGVAVTRNTGVLGLGSNTITDTRNRNLEGGDPAAIFVNPRGNFRLRTGSPAIGKGSVTPGESATDINGDDRSAAPTDQGADEFVNSAPVARVAATAPTGRQFRPVTFSAAGSTDADGPISSYRWTFSDGTSTITSGPSVQHGFKDEGPARATLVVTDPNGASSAEAAATVTILDGLPPLVSIDKPKANQTIRLVTKAKGKKKSKRTRIAFGGRALDKSGVKQIIVSIRQVSRAKTRKKSKTKAKSSAKQCRWLSPNRGMIVRSCSKPVQITAKLSGASWTYTVPSRRRLTAGTWEIAAAGVDNAGAFGNLNPKAKVRFKLR